MADTIITVIGNLTADPELRFTGSGAAVANLTIASTPRSFDKRTNEFKDGETLFLRCSVWREQAENVAETLQKGMGVIAQGKLKSRTYETKEGEKRTVTELDIEAIGPDLRYASATVKRTGRSQGSQGGSGGFGGARTGGQPTGGFGASQPPAQGQWNQGAAWEQDNTEPPF